MGHKVIGRCCWRWLLLLPFQMRFNEVRRRFAALCPAPYKWRRPGNMPMTTLDGTGHTTAHWVGFWGPPVLGFQGKKYPQAPTFLTFLPNHRELRLEDLLRSPRQGQEEQVVQDHIQLGFQYLHGENQALPHWQLLLLFLFSQTRLLRVFCQQESCSKEGLACRAVGTPRSLPTC